MPNCTSAKGRRGRRERGAAATRGRWAVVHDNGERAENRNEVGVPRPRAAAVISIHPKVEAVRRVELVLHAVLRADARGVPCSVVNQVPPVGRERCQDSTGGCSAHGRVKGRCSTRRHCEEGTRGKEWVGTAVALLGAARAVKAVTVARDSGPVEALRAVPRGRPVVVLVRVELELERVSDGRRARQQLTQADRPPDGVQAAAAVAAERARPADARRVLPSRQLEREDGAPAAAHVQRLHELQRVVVGEKERRCIVVTERRDIHRGWKVQCAHFRPRDGAVCRGRRGTAPVSLQAAKQESLQGGR